VSAYTLNSNPSTEKINTHIKQEKNKLSKHQIGEDEQELNPAAAAQG
jgi:hypothetical protein